MSGEKPNPKQDPGAGNSEPSSEVELLHDLRQILKAHDSNTLRLWRSIFDPTLHLKVNFRDFCLQSKKISYAKDCVELFVEGKARYQDDLAVYHEELKREEAEAAQARHSRRSGMVAPDLASQLRAGRSAASKGRSSSKQGALAGAGQAMPTQVQNKLLPSQHSSSSLLSQSSSASAFARLQLNNSDMFHADAKPSNTILYFKYVDETAYTLFHNFRVWLNKEFQTFFQFFNQLTAQKRIFRQQMSAQMTQLGVRTNLPVYLIRYARLAEMWRGYNLEGAGGTTTTSSGGEGAGAGASGAGAARSSKSNLSGEEEGGSQTGPLRGGSCTTTTTAGAFVQVRGSLDDSRARQSGSPAEGSRGTTSGVAVASSGGATSSSSKKLAPRHSGSALDALLSQTAGGLDGEESGATKSPRAAVTWDQKFRSSTEQLSPTARRRMTRAMLTDVVVQPPTTSSASAHDGGSNALASLHQMRRGSRDTDGGGGGSSSSNSVVDESTSVLAEVAGVVGRDSGAAADPRFTVENYSLGSLRNQDTIRPEDAVLQPITGDSLSCSSTSSSKRRSTSKNLLQLVPGAASTNYNDDAHSSATASQEELMGILLQSRQEFVGLAGDAEPYSFFALEEVMDHCPSEEEFVPLPMINNLSNMDYVTETEFPALVLALGYGRYEGTKSPSEKFNQLCWLYQILDTNRKGFVTIEELQPLELSYYDRAIPFQGGAVMPGVQGKVGNGNAADEERKARILRLVEKRVKTQEAERAFYWHLQRLCRQRWPLVKGWRTFLAPPTAQSPYSVTKQVLGIFLRSIDFKASTSTLWEALDSDDSGSLDLEEFDLKSAIILAEFRLWCVNVYGSCMTFFKQMRRAVYEEQNLGLSPEVRRMDKKYELQREMKSSALLELGEPGSGSPPASPGGTAKLNRSPTAPAFGARSPTLSELVSASSPHRKATVAFGRSQTAAATQFTRADPGSPSPRVSPANAKVQIAEPEETKPKPRPKAFNRSATMILAQAGVDVQMGPEQESSAPSAPSPPPAVLSCSASRGTRASASATPSKASSPVSSPQRPCPPSGTGIDTAGVVKMRHEFVSQQSGRLAVMQSDYAKDEDAINAGSLSHSGASAEEDLDDEVFLSGGTVPEPSTPDGNIGGCTELDLPSSPMLGRRERDLVEGGRKRVLNEGTGYDLIAGRHVIWFFSERIPSKHAFSLRFLRYLVRSLTLAEGPSHGVTKRDFEWLDNWDPPRYLTARGSQRAWKYIHDLILEDPENRCGGSFVLYWLRYFDRSSLNRVSWEAFHRESSIVLDWSGKFSEQDRERVIASAWVYLDASRDGTICMEEVDEKTSRVFMKFRAWCKRNFGSVHETFAALDVDNEGEISFTIFRTACKRWQGFSGQDLTDLIQAISEKRPGGSSAVDARGRSSSSSGLGGHGRASASGASRGGSKRSSSNGSAAGPGGGATGSGTSGAATSAAGGGGVTTTGGASSSSTSSGLKRGVRYQDLAFLDAWADDEAGNRHEVLITNPDYFKPRTKAAELFAAAAGASSPGGVGGAGSSRDEDSGSDQKTSPADHMGRFYCRNIVEELDLCLSVMNAEPSIRESTRANFPPGGPPPPSFPSLRNTATLSHRLSRPPTSGAADPGAVYRNKNFGLPKTWAEMSYSNTKREWCLRQEREFEVQSLRESVLCEPARPQTTPERRFLRARMYSAGYNRDRGGARFTGANWSFVAGADNLSIFTHADHAVPNNLRRLGGGGSPGALGGGGPTTLNSASPRMRTAEYYSASYHPPDIVHKQHAFSTGTSQWRYKVQRPQKFFSHKQIAPFMLNEKYDFKQDLQMSKLRKKHGSHLNYSHNVIPPPRGAMEEKFDLNDEGIASNWLGVWGEIHGREVDDAPPASSPEDVKSAFDGAAAESGSAINRDTAPAAEAPVVPPSISSAANPNEASENPANESAAPAVGGKTVAPESGTTNQNAATTKTRPESAPMGVSPRKGVRNADGSISAVEVYPDKNANRRKAFNYKVLLEDDSSEQLLPSAEDRRAAAAAAAAVPRPRSPTRPVAPDEERNNVSAGPPGGGFFSTRPATRAHGKNSARQRIVSTRKLDALVSEVRQESLERKKQLAGAGGGRAAAGGARGGGRRGNNNANNSFSRPRTSPTRFSTGEGLSLLGPADWADVSLERYPFDLGKLYPKPGRRHGKQDLRRLANEFAQTTRSRRPPADLLPELSLSVK